MNKRVVAAVLVVAIIASALLFVGTVFLNNSVAKNGDGGTPPVVIPPSNDTDTTPGPLQPPPKGPLNYIIIVTDDQRSDTLQYMPTVQEEFAKKGVLFKNSFVTTPLCCPSRASFISGGFYPFNTGVLTNGLPNGGATQFNDLDTIATELQQKGYTTGMIGKYLNGYQKVAPKIPPGWDSFEAVSRPLDWINYELVTGSSTFDQAGTGKIEEKNGPYVTYFERDQALSFIDKSSGSPFFLYLALEAPHSPAIPAPEDKDKFANFTFQNPGTEETDMSDKPQWVKDFPKGKDHSADSGEGEGSDNSSPNFVKGQLGSLQAVDRSVAAIMQKLEQKGLMNNTVIVYTSDNGIQWGEHGVSGKSKPYEESIRIPLAIRMPGVQPREDTHLVTWNLDLPATIFNLTGIAHKTDGMNLYPLLAGQKNAPWRDHVVFQSFDWHGKDTSAAWRAIRTQNSTYVEYRSGEKEFYDLVHDPYELQSQHNNPAFKDKMAEYSKMMDPLTGLFIQTTDLPDAQLNKPYSFSMAAFGGAEPYKWTIVDGELPSGVQLNSDTGVISGTPTAVGSYDFQIKVEDSSTSPSINGNQRYVISLTLSVT